MKLKPPMPGADPKPARQRLGLRQFETSRTICRCLTRTIRLATSLAILVALPLILFAQDISEIVTQRQPGTMRKKLGTGAVNHQPAGKPEVPAKVLQDLQFGEALHTLALAGALVELQDTAEIRLMEHTKLQILKDAVSPNPPIFSMLQGQAYYSTRRARAGALSFQTPQVRGTPSGTEFLIAVDPQNQRTEVTMFDGEVELTAGASYETVRSGQQGIVIAGQGIRVRPIIEATNLVQWWIYYPAVLDPDELGVASEGEGEFSPSLRAYRSGDLLRALEAYPGYPTPADPATDAERVYLAALFLALGAVDRAQGQLSRLTNSNAPPARALRVMIAAVAPPFGSAASTGNPSNYASGFTDHAASSASELMAISYAQQAAYDLKAALVSARQAVARSPRFGFGWARVAELEFSFGRTGAAREAVQRALELSPRNAQAHALNGFLLAAENRTGDALAAFDMAIEIDPALGNAWLGRGLCRIRRSAFRFPHSALEDLQTAALLEPNRSLLHSYAGKALVDAGEWSLAHKELAYARRLDTNDPTGWLYSALLKRDENRINEAVRDLERSVELNDNRAVYRSTLLLDQDRAVRSSSLANIYQSAGMNEVSVREAARALSYDYANHSSHQFLSESFNALRDPTRFNLRYATPWLGELLLANLLSPVGATPLSQQISQQEYSRLFERDRIGLSSDTLYRSDGQVRELASQYGNVGNFGWALDLDYQHNDGIRPNNELDRIEWYTTLKYQLTPQDSVLLLTKYQDYHSGDNFQYYDPEASVRPDFSYDEVQNGVVLGGYHHQWSPGVHTLLLGGRLINEQRFTDHLDGGRSSLVLIENPDRTIQGVLRSGFDLDYRNEFEIFTSELNQIFQGEFWSLVAGGRFQSGSFETHDLLENPTSFTNRFASPAAHTHVTEDFERITGYSYLTVKPLKRLWLTAGLTYDRITLPENHRHPPITPGQVTRDQFGPKAAIVWNPFSRLTLRGAYTRSLGGVSFDESYRLEPTQLAGFPQAFRTVISESVVGSVSAPTFETTDLALDMKLADQTYAGIQADAIDSEVRRTVGVFRAPQGIPPFVPSFPTPERLDYRERSLAVTLNQLLGDEWSFGVGYRFTRAELETLLPEIPTSVLPEADRSERANLHQVSFSALYNHPSGFFTRAETHWYEQDNFGYSPPLSGDSFFQHNVFIGYRLPRRRAELVLGILNLADQDYRLNPLTIYNELPRERVYVAQLRFRF